MKKKLRREGKYQINTRVLEDIQYALDGVYTCMIATRKNVQL